MLQFVKYGLCGGLATIAHLGTVLILINTALPGLEGMVVNGQPISDEVRATNVLLANAAGFILSNFTAYFSNVIWVFERGRHKIWLEFALFTLVALFAFLAAALAGPLLIRYFGISTLLAQVLFMITATAVNFISRKVFIFKG